MYEENTNIAPPEEQAVENDRDARAEELESTFSYDGYQVVRKELFAHLRDPAIVIRKDSITFNTACITGLEDVVYVHVMFNSDLKRIVVRGCDENEKDGKSVLVVDKRPNIAGNIYTENIEGINVHKYGAHIFHTNNKKVWNYITRFAEFNRFTNSPVANYKGELYSLPFNMLTFNKMWGVVTPEEAASKIEEQRKEITHEPQNLEEQAISLVGRDIYEKLIKGYTEKQWGRDCKDLPAFIIKRLPVRLTFDNNYFNALYQGIPIGGYTKMMGYKDIYRLWLNDDFFDEATRRELRSLTDEKEIEDRFYRNLEFGTGGLRGVMGAGTNRMNKYTVGKATAGLGKYLLDTYGAEACKNRGVVIGYDTRNNSEFFSRTAANVLSGMGIRVYLHAHARPTPQLSFSVKFWNALAGVVVTASHNPKEYNGYKVYDEFGCQLVPWQAKQVISYVDSITDYHTINFKSDDSLVFMADVTDNFVMAVMKQSRYKNTAAKNDLKIVYTPLHGTGNVPVQKALRLDGFTQLDAVAEQVVPDGNFPTVVSPNPEDRSALEMGIAQAKRSNADIVLGTDPDSDRVGIAVKGGKGEYQLMTGNQVGALLMNFVLSHTDMGQYTHPAVVKTVVTSELGADIARKHGRNSEYNSDETWVEIIEVHPNDEYAREHEGDNGKTEMWYVIDADEGAHLIYGFQHEVTEEILRKAVETGTLDKHLQKVPVHKGDTYFVPAGTVHGIGKGILVAEIQESSNVTYRVYDYDRVDKNGKKRELHFDKAVQVMNMRVAPDVSQKPRIVKYYSGCSRELLCRCKYFETERIQVTKGFAFSVMNTSFQVLMCLNGYGEVQTMDAEQKPMRFSKGETLFLPAGLGRCLVVGDAELIKVRC